jgi:hypothetical protein
MSFNISTFPAEPKNGDIVFMPERQEFFLYQDGCWQVTQEMPAMPWRLFLDDERMPEDARWSFCNIARTVDEAIKLIDERGLPQSISFDHDLGKDQPVATVFMWHLINGHLDEKWDCRSIKHVQIHTANPEGAKNLIGLWEGFIQDQGIKCKITRVKAIQK